MRAGRLDKLVLIQAMTPARTTLGDTKPGEWATIRRVWARVARSQVVERFVTDQVQAEMSVAFEVRAWPAEVDPATQRVWYDNRPHNVHGVTDMGRGAGLLVVCTARGEPVPQPALQGA